MGRGGGGGGGDGGGGGGEGNGGGGGKTAERRGWTPQPGAGPAASGPEGTQATSDGEKREPGCMSGGNAGKRWGCEADARVDDGEEAIAGGEAEMGIGLKTAEGG